MKKLAIITFFLVFSMGWAQTLELKGRVVSSEGPPVAEAVVFHRVSGTQVTTDDDGNFELNLDIKENVTLEIIHTAYMEKEITLTSKDLSQTIVVMLSPYIRQKEEVVVTALRYPETATKIPAAETLIATELLREKMAPNITEALNGVPGVVPLGSGGFSLVPTIRGLARNRILILIDNARIASDRRTGPNASFVNPEDIAKIEVLRSPSSIFYGSDAIGGVVNIFTKSSGAEGIHGNVHAGYGTNNEEKKYGLSLSGKKGRLGFYVSYQADDAGNYSSPLGDILMSEFTQASLFGKLSYDSDPRQIEFSFLGARGTKIGKPTRDSATRPTWYPRENQNLIQARWQEKSLWGGEVNVLGYANPNFLETISERWGTYRTRESFSKTQSAEYGIQFSYAKKLNRSLRVTGGVDYFGRGGVKSENRDISFDAQGNITKITSETPYTKGLRRDLGFYVSGDYSGLKNLDVVGGARWDYLFQRANPGDEPTALKSEKNAWTGFFAISYKVTDQIVAFANVSRAYRVPGLSELFYSGITGRGFIIAQPNLKPETSLNGDLGIRLFSRRFFAGIYAFQYSIDNLIDRILLSEKDSIYTYENVDNGRIKGLELELEYYPVPGWKLFGNIFTLRGESRDTAIPLNDVPPLRVFAGSRIWIKKLSIEVTGTFQQKKDKPGPAEIAIPAYEYFQIKANYTWHPLDFYLVLSNVFNKTYFGRPDPDAMQEPGRSLVFGLSYGF
jgi:outer membrane receptor protein involved in Fe transport